VGDHQLRMKFFREVRSPLQRFLTLRAEIDSAQDLAEAARPIGRGVRNMCARKNRTIRVMQDFGGNRAQDKAAEGSVSVRRDHDETGALGMCEVDDLGGGISRYHLPAHVHVPEFAWQEVRQQTLRYAPPLGGECSDDGTGEFVRAYFICARIHHMHEGQLGMKVARQPAGIAAAPVERSEKSIGARILGSDSIFSPFN
jgi:hypothetical protein